jgi:hypothetical protein
LKIKKRYISMAGAFWGGHDTEREQRRALKAAHPRLDEHPEYGFEEEDSRYNLQRVDQEFQYGQDAMEEASKSCERPTNQFNFDWIFVS